MSAKFTRAEILDAATEHFGIEAQQFYSEDQARDDRGRWGSGSQKGQNAERAVTHDQLQKAANYHAGAAEVLDRRGMHDAADAHRQAMDAHREAAQSKGSSQETSAIEHANATSVHAHATTDRVTARLVDEKRYAPGQAPRGQSTRDYAQRIHDARTRAMRSGADDSAAETFSGERTAVRLSFAAALALADDDEPERRVVDGVTYVVGKPIHIFPQGEWTAVDGRHVEFNADDARSLMGDLKTRHSDVALTFDHEHDKARGSEAAGWMPIGAFVFRADGLWNDEPLWREGVYDTLIKTGGFRYLSGDALGIGSADAGNAFHPRRLLAASLVPKPGFVRGLKGITLAADERAQVDAWVGEKFYSDDQPRDDHGRWGGGGSIGKTASGKDVPGHAHAAYTERQKMPKYNGPVSPALAGGNTAGQMLRQRMPEFSKQDHLDAYQAHAGAAKAAEQSWNKTADAAAQVTFGRPFAPTDYKISGIGSDKFSEPHKSALREAAQGASAHRDAAAAHWYAAGKRSRVTFAAEGGRQFHVYDKETTMAKMTRAELCQQMGIPPTATKEEFTSALEKWAKEEADEPEHKDSMKAGASDAEPGCDCSNCKGLRDGDENDPEPGCDCSACEDDNGEKMGAKKTKEEKMGANDKTPGTGDEKLVADQFAARFEKMGTDLADKAVESATKAADAAAEKRINERFAADARQKEVDTLIADGLKDGRLKGDEMATLFRETFAVNHDHGKKLLAGLPKPDVAPGDPLAKRHQFVTGNGSATMTREDLRVIFDNPDRDSHKYAAQSKFLTAVARFSSQTGIDPASAMASVLRGENEKLEREIFSAEGKTAEEFTGETVGQFRASQRQLPVDPELIAFLKTRQSRGDIPKFVVREEIQQFASITDFQPSARTTLPMALGYFQSEFVGDEALPVFIGGADEKAAWPELAFEKFAAIASAAGLLGSPNETSLNVIWHTVTLDKYPVRGNIDRRARSASITLPRGIDTIMLENLKSQVGVTKETAQAAFLTTNGNYFDSSYYPSVTAWSSAGTPAAYVSLPIEDVYKGMQHVRVGVRAWPDLLLLSPAAAAALRKNQQIIDTVRFTGTQERPGTGVSNQTLAAIFQGLFNLTIVVGEAGTASLPSGSPVTDVWGLDAWLLCTGKGQIEAPRFGMTVGAAGSPRVRAFPAEHLGADGADAIVYTDAWQLASISKKAGYRMVGASAAL